MMHTSSFIVEKYNGCECMNGESHTTSPLVSVIIGVYNGGRWLRETIDSVLAQTHANFEVVLVNDGSTDNSAGIISSYEDARIVFIDRKENKGLTKSLNEGLRGAHGSYIARLDVGDIALPTRIEDQVRFLEQNPAVGIIGSGIELFCDDHVLDTYLYSSEPDTIKDQLFHFINPLPHSTLMLRKGIIQQLNGYCENFVRSQDYDLLLRALEVTSLSSLQKVLVRWRFDPFSLSYSSPKQLLYGIAALIRARYRLKGCGDITESDVWSHVLRYIEQFIRQYKLDTKMAAGKYSMLLRSSWVSRQYGSFIRNAMQFLVHNPSFFTSPRARVSACVSTHIEEILPSSLC